MMFPKCPDCSCEHKEKCVQYDDIEDAVWELKEKMKEHNCPTGGWGYCNNCSYCSNTDRIIDEVFREVE